MAFPGTRGEALHDVGFVSVFITIWKELWNLDHSIKFTQLFREDLRSSDDSFLE